MAPVTEFDATLKELVADMIATMRAAPGVGLAANQIGVDRQLVVIGMPSQEERQEPLVLVNPAILRGEGSQTDEEGCLSLLDFTANIKRFYKIWVRCQDVEGQACEFEAEDMLARIIQHEVDHLDGILCLDRVSAIKRALYKKKRKKQLEEEALSEGKRET